MSKVVDGWRDYRDRSSVQEFPGADHEGLPEISALLCGKADASKTGWERPPLSLLLFLDGQQLTFCFSKEDFAMQLWGGCASLKDGLLGVEEALCRENCQWKKKKSYDNGFTSHKR
jgi:hypothetical protein